MAISIVSTDLLVCPAVDEVVIVYYDLWCLLSFPIPNANHKLGTYIKILFYNSFFYYVMININLYFLPQNFKAPRASWMSVLFYSTSNLFVLSCKEVFHKQCDFLGKFLVDETA